MNNAQNQNAAEPAQPRDAEALLALLHAIYLQAGLAFEAARQAALADYTCSFSGEIEALAA